MGLLKLPPHFHVSHKAGKPLSCRPQPQLQTLEPIFIVSTHQTINKSFQRERSPLEDWGWSILLENKGCVSKNTSSPTGQKRSPLSEGGFPWRRWTSFLNFLIFSAFSASLCKNVSKLLKSRYPEGLSQVNLDTHAHICMWTESTEVSAARNGHKGGCPTAWASRAEKGKRGSEQG